LGNVLRMMRKGLTKTGTKGGFAPPRQSPSSSASSATRGKKDGIVKREREEEEQEESAVVQKRAGEEEKVTPLKGEKQKTSSRIGSSVKIEPWTCASCNTLNTELMVQCEICDVRRQSLHEANFLPQEQGKKKREGKERENAKEEKGEQEQEHFLMKREEKQNQ
jgi:hypothetical protein